MFYSAATDTVLMASHDTRFDKAGIVERDTSGNLVRLFDVPDGFLGAAGVTRGPGGDVFATEIGIDTVYRWTADGARSSAQSTSATMSTGRTTSSGPATSFPNRRAWRCSASEASWRCAANERGRNAPRSPEPTPARAAGPPPVGAPAHPPGAARSGRVSSFDDPAPTPTASAAAAAAREDGREPSISRCGVAPRIHRIVRRFRGSCHTTCDTAVPATDRNRPTASKTGRPWRAACPCPGRCEWSSTRTAFTHSDHADDLACRPFAWRWSNSAKTAFGSASVQAIATCPTRQRCRGQPRSFTLTARAVRCGGRGGRGPRSPAERCCLARARR